MRILYGVAGEGLGHAMRSRVVAEHLRSRGHQVKLVSSGRACGYLQRSFEDVQPIPGFAFAYRNERLARCRSLALLGRSVVPAIRESIELYRGTIARFSPDACISDFDSFTHIFGRLFARPVISLDHQHVVDRCAHAVPLPRDFALTRAVVRGKLPGCGHYVVTSFYFPEPRRADTTLVGPILRDEVLALEPTLGDHVLVYQTAAITPELVAALRAVPEHKFVAYSRGDAGEWGNVSVRSFDESRFLEDLATSRAVICNGGYTLMAEALYLGKPILSLPIRHQGEQELNAAYLAALGLGVASTHLDSRAIRTFLRDLAPVPRIRAGNRCAFATLDRLLERTT